MHQTLEPYAKANERWLCKCMKCDGESYKRLYALTWEGSRNCSLCSLRELGTTVYLVHNDELRSYKVGVGKPRRISEHLSRGWVLISSWDLDSPIQAYALEGEALNYIRQIWGLAPFLGKEEMPQNGHTETFSADDLPASVVTDLVNKLRVQA
jgi:hypothetical protein